MRALTRPSPGAGDVVVVAGPCHDPDTVDLALAGGVVFVAAESCSSPRGRSRRVTHWYRQCAWTFVVPLHLDAAIGEMRTGTARDFEDLGDSLHNDSYRYP